MGELTHGADGQEEFVQGLVVHDHLRNQHVNAQKTIGGLMGDVLKAQLEKAKKAREAQDGEAGAADYEKMLALQRRLTAGPERQMTETSSGGRTVIRGLTLIQGGPQPKPQLQERYKPKEAIDKAYLQRLLQRHLRSTFLHKDLKSVQSSAFQEDTQDMAKEFAKECYRTGNAPPVSRIAVNELAAFRKDLYLLNNTSLSEDQSNALGNTFKYMKREINELCFSNNNLKDKQFADLLAKLVSVPAQFDSLQRITYANSNELGPLTLAVLHRILDEKSSQFPLTHLALANCKLRLGSILPLLSTLNAIPNVLQTLIIPQQNFGYEGVGALCQLIAAQPSFLKVLDISWNSLTQQQVGLVFQALGKNQDLEYLNLAMTSVGPEMDTVKLRRFIRKNMTLLHLDLSGMFKTAEHV